MSKPQNHTAANTIMGLDLFGYFDRKYYGISLSENEEKTWNILFNHVIDKSKFFEYSIGSNFSDPSFDKMREEIDVFPDKSENPDKEFYKSEYENLKQVGLDENIVQFYSTKKFKIEQFKYDHYIARLKIDNHLKTILSGVKSFMDYEHDLKINEIEIEFNDSAFYEDKDTALLFTDHTDIKAYILLDEKEKKALEKQGIEFTDEKERAPITLPEDILTLEEIKKL